MRYLGFRLVGVLSGFLWMAGAACSAGETKDPEGGSGGTGGSTDGAGPQGGSGGEGGAVGGSTNEGGGFQGCTGIVCGNGDCCGEEQECVVDSCLPICDTEIRCGEDLSTCCAAGNVCIGGACTVPGNPCADWADCEEDEFCEPTIGACLPQPKGEPLCEYRPPVGPLAPQLEWSWTGSTIKPTFDQVINMPVVVDLDDDDTPDVMVVTSANFNDNGAAYLRALDGATGAEKWDQFSDAYLDANRVQPRATPAAGDIDGDGAPEIVAAKMGGGLIAFESNGDVKWTSTGLDGVTPWNLGLEAITISLADLEGDGDVEIVAGGAVFHADGSLKFNQGVYFGANGGTYGAVSIVANLDGTGSQEIVSGQRAFRAVGSLWWDNNLTDGYPAIADLDLDGTPELVVVAADTVRVQSPTTGVVLASVAMPGTGAGGPPTIADFDADGIPEIASANGSAYSVYEYTSTPTPALTVKWQKATQDLSSNRTGSSVFDFQGDGAAEVVYNDECYLRVYSGADGTIVYEEPNSSGTIHEYPVIVDVDGDNNTEIVVVANNYNHGAGTCPYGVAGARKGVFVYGDSEDNWVRTRRVWNQHAYHITNVDGNGGIPGPEAPSWVVPPGLNNYRQSSQGAGVFNAPDLQVSLAADLDTCPTEVALRARVRNQGSLGVAPGVVVRIFRGTDANGTLLAETMTTQILLPGQYEEIVLPYELLPSDDVMSFFVEVDKDDGTLDAIHECLEDNNEASVDGVECPPAT